MAWNVKPFHDSKISICISARCKWIIHTIMPFFIYQLYFNAFEFDFVMSLFLIKFFNFFLRNVTTILILPLFSFFVLSEYSILIDIKYSIIYLTNYSNHILFNQNLDIEITGVYLVLLILLSNKLKYFSFKVVSFKYDCQCSSTTFQCSYILATL